MSWDVWGAPLIILAVGLAVGVVVAMLTRDTSGTAAPLDPERARQEELRAQHASLMHQLRELEADRDKLRDEDYARLRESLIGQAAETLRALDAPAPAPSPRAPTGSSGRGEQAVIWIGAAVAFFALLGVLISQNTTARQEGQVMTGGAAMAGGGGGGGGEEAAMMQELLAAREVRKTLAGQALAADPADLEALNVLTYDALLYRDLEDAMKYMESARAINAEDPQVLIHLSILQMSVGMNERAAEGLAASEKQRPDDPKLLLWRGFLRAQQGEKAAAEADLMAAASSKTLWEEERILAFSLIRELRAGPPQGAAGMASSAPPEASGPPRVSGEVVAGEGVVIPDGAVLFVYVRRAEQAAGPPVAAVRFSSSGVPQAFAIGDAQMLPMAGGVWPEEVWLQARIDLDGNAATREEGAPVSEVMGPIRAGAEGLSLVLH